VLPAPSCFPRVPVIVCLVPFFLKVCFRAGLGLLTAGVVAVVLQFCVYQRGHVLPLLVELYVVLVGLCFLPYSDL
jgi:intracellular septation protein A